MNFYLRTGMAILLLLALLGAVRADPLGGDIASGLAGAAVFSFVLFGLFSLFVAAIESAVVAAAFHLDGTRTFWILALANIVSGLVGFIGGFFTGSLAAKLIGYYVLAVVIEWPFLRWAVNDGPKRETDAWKASFLAQTTSYGILLLPTLWWYDLLTPIGTGMLWSLGGAYFVF